MGRWRPTGLLVVPGAISEIAGSTSGALHADAFALMSGTQAEYDSATGQLFEFLDQCEKGLADGRRLG